MVLAIKNYAERQQPDLGVYNPLVASDLPWIENCTKLSVPLFVWQKTGETKIWPAFVLVTWLAICIQ